MPRRTIYNFDMGSRGPDFASGEQEQKILSDEILKEDFDEELDIDDLPV